MSRVLTFSTHFPKNHAISAGDRTYFPEYIMAGLADYLPMNWHIPEDFLHWEPEKYMSCYTPKGHTIRRGKRWKVGDKFSPRGWSGIPYRSKQIAFCSVDIEVTQVYDFRYNGNRIYINDVKLELECKTVRALAQNDGLTALQLYAWLNMGKPTPEQPFDGQIICWLPGIVYPTY